MTVFLPNQYLTVDQQVDILLFKQRRFLRTYNNAVTQHYYSY